MCGRGESGFSFSDNESDDNSELLFLLLKLLEFALFSLC